MRLFNWIKILKPISIEGELYQDFLEMRITKSGKIALSMDKDVVNRIGVFNLAVPLSLFLVGLLLGDGYTREGFHRMIDDMWDEAIGYERREDE